MGTWRIVAHYRGEEAYAASVEFKVQKFGRTNWFVIDLCLRIIKLCSCLELHIFFPTLVLPSFEVNIVPWESYILLGTEQFHFTISAL